VGGGCCGGEGGAGAGVYGHFGWAGSDVGWCGWRWVGLFLFGGRVGSSGGWGRGGALVVGGGRGAEGGGFWGGGGGGYAGGGGGVVWWRGGIIMVGWGVWVLVGGGGGGFGWGWGLLVVGGGGGVAVGWCGWGRLGGGGFFGWGEPPPQTKTHIADLGSIGVFVFPRPPGHGKADLFPPGLVKRIDPL